MRALSLAALLMALTGCAGLGKKMKGFFGGKSESTEIARGPSARFSDTPNVNPSSGDKLYRRVSRESFEKEGMLDENSGSLWVMEGQGSYLFSPNLLRVPGDVLNVLLDGTPRSSMEKKVEIIKNLLDRSRRNNRTVAAAGAPSAPGAQPGAQPGTPAEGAAPAPGDQAQNAQGNQPGAPQASAEDKADAEDEKKSTFDVASIPSRIVEKTSDGSYRIRGSQSFMIGRREYRVIATGVVRPSDIKNDSIEASRLVDSKFDVVAIRKEPK